MIIKIFEGSISYSGDNNREFLLPDLSDQLLFSLGKIHVLCRVPGLLFRKVSYSHIWPWQGKAMI